MGNSVLIEVYPDNLVTSRGKDVTAVALAARQIEHP
jgi:hypothetical protein